MFGISKRKNDANRREENRIVLLLTGCGERVKIINRFIFSAGYDTRIDVANDTSGMASGKRSDQ